MNRPLEGARVLILEDEFFLADDLARALRNAGAEPVGPVATVEQAESLLADDGVDAAIVDLNLRGKMASEFVERLAATELPCLIVSGYGEDAMTGPATVPCLEKPVDADTVVRSLAIELARAS
jgi:ActR/RegA family two-component response regulator